ncbi:MAG: tetratricopeptide repeat protein [Bacteroidota bacterium]
MVSLRLFLALALLPAFLNAQDAHRLYGDAAIDSLLRHGIDLTLQHDYDGARDVFRSLSRRHPKDPAGYVFEAGVIQTMAMDYEEFIPGTEFDSLIGLAKTIAEEAINEDAKSGWPHLLLGTAIGNDAFTRAQRGDWFAAATLGMSSASSFESALDIDSSLVDAFAGIGTYYYWKTRKIQFLTWLPFVADRREEGIALLRRCAEEGVYNRFAAISSLVGIYNDAEAYDSSAAVAHRALAKYPGNRIFLWGLATALERGQRLSEALEAYERLLTAIRSDSRSSRYNELVCRLKLLTLNMTVKGRGSADKALAEILPLTKDPFPDHLSERAHVTIGKIKAIQKDLSSSAKP